MIRHMVMADRNSSSPTHFLSTTSTWRDHADNPPPNDASAMWLNVHANSNSDTFSRGGSSSLMQQVVVVREIALDVLGRVERVGRVVLVRQVPVGGKGVRQPRHHRRIA